MKTDININFYSIIDQLIRRLIVLERSEKFCYGVTMSQCYIIETLYKKEPLTMNELSSELGLAVSTLTRILDILFRDGIITRNHSTEDRRKVFIELTDNGKDIAQKLKSCSESYCREILNQIPSENREEVIKTLKILSDAIDTAKNKCCT